MRKRKQSRTVGMSEGQCDLWTHPDGTEISVTRREGIFGAYAEAHCHGDRGHFREDGGCEHMDELLAVNADGLLVLPFGGASPPDDAGPPQEEALL